MKASNGTDLHKDENGNVVYVWQETSIPGDTGYETFGNTITDPKAPTSSASPTSPTSLDL